MRAFFAQRSSGFLVVASAATPLCTVHRRIFIRKLTTPVLLENSDSGPEPFPARLLWQYNSRQPRHVVMHLRGPEQPAAPQIASDSAFEDLEEAEEAAAAAAAAAGSAAPRDPAEYLYGRLFLRPYNVAQLLTVLQGWSSEPAVIVRERATLTLAAASAASPATTTGKSGAALDVPPSEVTLTATLTRKVIESPLGDVDEAATTRAAIVNSRGDDRAADRNDPDSVYVEGSVGTVRAVLRDADVVLLTAHLESVLRDLFSIEHHYHEARRRAMQGEHGQRNASSAQGHHLQGRSQTSASSSASYASRKAAHKSRPQYRSQSVNNGTTSTNAAPRHPASAGAAATSSAAAAPSPATPAAADDEYEVVEEVEVEEGEEVADSAEADKGSSESGAAGSAPATIAAAAATTPHKTYKTTHTQEKGAMTMESDAHYAEGRFMRDGSVTAAVVEGVSHVGDFDVRHRTRQAQGATASDGARTTTHATASTGAFRSTGGEVSGTFSYERIDTVTEADTVAAASKAAAAAQIPVHHGGGEATMEARATTSAPGSAAAAVTQEEDAEEDAAAEAAPATPARKSRSTDRSASAAAAKKKKAGKKKPKKAPAKRKSPAAKPTHATAATAERPPAASPDSMTF